MQRKDLYFYTVLVNFLLIIVLFYCEYVHYYLVLILCKWPIKNSVNKKFNIVAVADTHLLGTRNGHWWDKLRREWQMYRSFQTSVNLHQPDAVIFLGDLFDEGKWCSEKTFYEYVDRFNSLFYLPSNVQLLITAGNHDIGFHYSTNNYLANRFVKALNSSLVQLQTIKGAHFVLINSVAMHGDHCKLCDEAVREVRRIAGQLKCLNNTNSENCKLDENMKDLKYSQPIILQHYPMYRKSDEECLESDTPAHLKHEKFRQRWECLSRDSTDMLYSELEPRLVLSGHTHHTCIKNKTWKSRGKRFNTVEYSVASFSWRNKVDPSFAMISIDANDFKIQKCEMPNENTVICIYISSLLIILMGLFCHYWFCRRSLKFKIA